MDDRLIRTRLKHPGYELFILGLSFLSLVNLAILVIRPDGEVDQVITIVDGLLCIIFLIDFAWRLATAPDRRVYMRWGWADFLGSLPVPGLRLFRSVYIVRAVALLREAGGRRVVRQIFRERAESAICLVAFIAITVLELAASLVLVAERADPASNIRTGGDALWWAWVSVTTVGYGDYYPVTSWGRVIGSVLLGVGIGLVTTITGFLATKLLPQGVRQPAAEAEIEDAAEHIGETTDTSETEEAS